MADRLTVAGVVTQPDRPSGRGQRTIPTPVKTAALARGLRVYEPERLRPFVDEARALAPDLLVIASYGKILPQALLDIAPLGAFNVHPSLLPLYRGATPLPSAIRDGRGETGVTIIAMDAGMDTGDMLVQERTPLGADETGGALHDRLALRGAALLIDAIDAAENGTLVRTPQSSLGIAPSEIAATVTRPLSKDDLLVDFTADTAHIVNLVRALSPQPTARAVVDGETLKVLAARIAQPDESLGTITGDDGVVLAAGAGNVVFLRVVPPNRAAMSGGAWRRAAVRA